MKVKHFFGLAVLAAMTASCSSNDELVNNVSGNEANEGKVGYAAFSINLPTAGSMTRAADAGGAEVSEGTKEEYAVKDATAIIFQKDNTAEGGSVSYKFVESVDLGNLLWEKDNAPGITTTATKVAKLNKVVDDGSYYALILLNNKTADGSNKVELPTTGTYESWNGTILENVDFASNGIFMANAPLLSETTPATLVNIKQGQIYTTKEAAEKATANTEIYVERGVAKVDVLAPDNLNADGTIDVKENGTGNPTGDKVKFSNWALDVTNKKTFAVHTYEGLSGSFSAIWSTPRFKGTNNRIYWAQDPNYTSGNLNGVDEASDNARKAEFNYITKSDVDVDFGTAKYCLENTFDINDMNQGQTTRVVFKSVYTPSGYTTDATFYKVGKTMVKDADALKTLINDAANAVLADCKLKDDAALLTKAGSYLLKPTDLKVGDVDLADTETKQYNGNTQSGKEVAAAINAKLGLEGNESTRPEDIVGINTYEKGETYYIARIKHFGDLTPWNVGDPTYNGDNAKYLGRYGVLRNNWYELKVNSVSGLGYPDVPPVDPDMPDDENEKYISVSVKILDWAKRSQTVDL